MNKRIVFIALAMAFALSTATAGFSATVKCTVDSVDGDKVTMTCEKADKLKVGDKVKVKPGKKKGAIEGC